MKSKITAIVFVVGLSAVLLIAPSAMAKKMVLKTALTYSSTLPILGETITYFSSKVKEVSDDQLIFKLFEPGKLVPAMEILEAVSKGQIEAGYANPGFSAGKLPAGPC